MNERRPAERRRRSNGQRDLLWILLGVAALFALGEALGPHDRLESAMRSLAWLDEAVALTILALGGLALFAGRRWRQQVDEHRRREETEARFRAVIEESPAVSYTWDSPARCASYVSPQIEQLLGYTPEEWRDPDLWKELLHPDDRNRVIEASLRADRTGTRFAEEYRTRTRDGRWRWLHDESNYVAFDAHGRPLVAQGVFYDVTERRDAEERLHETQARFRAIVEHVPAISYVWDSSVPSGTGPATYISPQIEPLLGYRADAWLADPEAWNVAVHPDDRERVLEDWERASAVGAPFKSEYRIHRSDGTLMWLADEANPVGPGETGAPIYQGVMTDITARKEAEIRLADTEARSRTLLEHLPVVAYMVEREADGSIRDRWVSPAIERLLGVQPDRWTGATESWEDAVHPDDRAAVFAAWDASDEAGQPFRMEYRMLRSDGEIVWVRDEAVMMRRDGRSYVEGVYIDVTARREAEAAAREAEGRFKTLVERIPVVTYSTAVRSDGEDIVTYVAPGIRALLGYDPETCLNDPEFWSRVIHPDDLAGVMRRSEDADNSGASFDVEYRMVRSDGVVIWVQDSAVVYRRSDEGHTVWLGVLADVTDRRATGVQLRQAQERSRVLIEQIRAAEERYRNLVEQLPVAVYTDAVDETSTAIYISPRYEELTGYSAEQRLADPELWVNMLHPLDRERVLAESARTNRTGEPFDVEYRIVAADGRTVWLHDHASMVAGPDGASLWQGVLTDVTEERAAQDALSRRDRILEATSFAAGRFLTSTSWTSEIDGALERLGRAGEASRAFVCLNEDGPDGDTLVSVAHEWQAPGWEVSGIEDLEHRFPWRAGGFGRWADLLASGEVVHGRVEDFPPEERVALERPELKLRSLVAVPVFVDDHWWGYLGFDHCEDGRVWQDGEIEALSVAARTLGAAISRERSARELADAQLRYQTLIEQIPAMTYVEQAGTGDAIYSSPQVSQVLGYASNEWGTYEQWAAALHPEDRDRVIAEDRRTNITGERFQLEYRLIARDGRVVWVRDAAVRVNSDDGHPSYWQGVRFDITSEKEAERQLREAEERYRQLVEQTPAITYLDERPSQSDHLWPTVYVSPQVESILGVTAEAWEADPSRWLAMIHPDDRRRAREADRHHYDLGEPLDIELRIQVADGDYRWFRDQAVIIHDEEGLPRYSQGILFDVTERKVAEQALHEAEQRFRTLIETIPAVTYMDAIDESWTILYVSPQVEDVFGYTPDAWRGMHEGWLESIHPDDRVAITQAVLALNEHGTPLDLEYRFRHRDGHWVWVRDQGVVIRDEEGKALFSQGVMYDVTDAKHSEESLREAEERFRGIVEHVPAVIYLDRPGPTMEAVYVSPQVEWITGITPEHWLSDPEALMNAIDPEDRADVVAGYLSATDRGEPWSAEYRIRTPDGRTVWLHDETTFLHDEEGGVAFVQGVLYDVTERKLAEQALRESELREREAAERLRALDEMKNTFLAAVSHELRSPLTSILGLALTLERAPDMNERDRGDLLQRLATNSRKLDGLLKDLLDIDRLNRGIVAPQYRVADVGALARRTVESLDQLAGRDVITQTDAIVLKVDPPKVERIIENLLMNAARHTTPDRRIWLRVEPRDGGVLIAVEDDGPGVPQDLRSAIFEPFLQGPTASAHSPGTGIGLSLVARFAELHEGRAWVEERDGGGASFRVFLPGRHTSDPSEAAADLAGSRMV